LGAKGEKNGKRDEPWVKKRILGVLTHFPRKRNSHARGDKDGDISFIREVSGGHS